MKRTSNARRGAAAVATAGAVLGLALGVESYQACAVYEPSLLLPSDVDAGAPDAAPDADTCAHVRPPSRPDASDGNGQGILVIAAFKTIDIGLTAEAGAPRPPYGYDLDGVCTCPGPPSCAQQTGVPESCDDEAGRDNTAIDLFRGLGVAASTGTSQIDDGLASGQYGLLLVIDEYNGQPNDPQVKVSYYVSNGVNRASDGGIPPPDFMGNDLWTIDPGSLIGNTQDLVKIKSCAKNSQCQPVYSDDQAYVADNVVVANFIDQIPVAFGDRSFLGGATMSLSGAVIVGQLQPVPLAVGFSYELTGGTIAGRWPTSQLLSTLATIPDPMIDGGFLCGSGSVNYELLKAVACEAADISQNSLYDNASPPAACDAVSIGMRFAAGPAQLGAVYAVAPAPAGCADGGLAFTDKCP